MSDVYFPPVAMRCTKCGYEVDESPRAPHAVPRIGDFIGCPICWERFLRSNVGELLGTVDVTGQGSQWDRVRDGERKNP